MNHLDRDDRITMETAAGGRGLAPSFVEELLAHCPAEYDTDGRAHVSVPNARGGFDRFRPVDAVAVFAERHPDAAEEHRAQRSNDGAASDLNARCLDLLTGGRAPWKPDAEPVDALTEELARAFGPDLRRVI